MCLIIRLAKLLNRLRSSGENTFEEPPVGRTSYEALAEGDECGKMSYRIRRKVMELRPEVSHDTSEEGMGRLLGNVAWETKISYAHEDLSW